MTLTATPDRLPTTANRPPASPPPAPPSLPAATLAVAGRTVARFVRTPQLIVVGTIQGAMFLLIFRYVFGGAISAGPVPYVDYLVPGFVTTTVLFVGTATAAGVAEDREQGFVDRLRSLPVPRSSILAGRVLADVGMLAWNLAVTVAFGFAVGFRLHASPLAGLAAFGLCLLFGVAATWLFVLIGLVAGNAQAAQGMSLLVFPFTFVSSAYVPVASMPGWLQAFARHQPVTAMVEAVRALCLGDQAQAVLGHPAGHYLGPALAWSAALIAAFLPPAVAALRRG